jgi:hypothetical protein
VVSLERLTYDIVEQLSSVVWAIAASAKRSKDDVADEVVSLERLTYDIVEQLSSVVWASRVSAKRSKRRRG